MDNEFDQSKVAYENGPKEVNVKRGLHDGNKQFGKNKMPQDDKMSPKASLKVGKIHRQGRHSEHR